MVNMVGFHHKEPTYNTASYGDEGWHATLRVGKGGRATITSPCAHYRIQPDNTLWHDHPGSTAILARLATWWLKHGNGQPHAWTNETATTTLERKPL